MPARFARLRNIEHAFDMKSAADDLDGYARGPAIHREGRAITLRFPPELRAGAGDTEHERASGATVEERTETDSQVPSPMGTPKYDVSPPKSARSERTSLLPAGSEGTDGVAFSLSIHPVCGGARLEPAQRRNLSPSSLALMRARPLQASSVRQPRTVRRRWPAVLGFSIASLLVSGVLLGVVLRRTNATSTPDRSIASARARDSEPPATSSRSAVSEQPPTAESTPLPTSATREARPTPSSVAALSNAASGARQKTAASARRKRPAPLETREPRLSVDEIYVNSKGELVDAAGKPITTPRSQR
jgi:hypothetical protein